MPGGYFGRALVVELDDGSSSVLELPEPVLRAYLGGSGLGTWLMHRLAPPGVDPLAPEAPLAFVFSPLVGTPLTTSAKFAVVAKSPLTGHAQRRPLLQPLRHLGQADRVRRHRRARPLRRAVGPARGRRRGPARRGRRTCGACRPPRPSAALVRTARPGLAGRLDRPGGRARRPLRHDLPRRPARRPGRARRGDGRQEPQGRRRPRRHQGRPGRPRGRAGRRPGPAGAVLRARPPRSTASSARWRTCWRSTPSTRCPPATSQRRPSLSAPRLAAEDLAGLRRVARNSCASCTIGCEHIYRAGTAAPRRGWSTRTSSPSARCAGCPTPTTVLDGQRPLRRRWGSTPSRPAAPSPGRWSASSGGCSTRRGCGSATATALLRALDEIGRREGLGALLAEGSRRAAARGGRRLRRLRPAGQGAGAARLRAAHAAGDGARAGRERPRRGPQPLRRLRGRPVRRPGPVRRRPGARRSRRSRPRTGPR